MKYIVRFFPPYTNGSKDVEFQMLISANNLRDWFMSIGVNAIIVKQSITEEEISCK